MKNLKYKFLILVILISCLQYSKTQDATPLTFHLHNDFVEEISYIQGTDKVISGSRNGRVVIKSISGNEDAKVCELGEWIYQLSHVEGTNYILAISGNTKIYRIDYTTPNCSIIYVSTSSPNKLLRVTNENVPAGKIYYYFISRQFQILHVLDIQDMTVLTNNYPHNSEGFMMAVSEYGTEKNIITAGDDRKITIRYWNGTVVEIVSSAELSQTTTSSSIWGLNWIEGTDFVIVSFNDGTAKVINLKEKTLLSVFDKQAASFGITKVQRIEGSNLFISFGFSLETVYVWDYRNPQNYRYRVNSAIMTNTAGSYIGGTGLICSRSIQDSSALYYQKYFCQKICGDTLVYNFDWAQCSETSYCSNTDSQQLNLGYCKKCEVKKFFYENQCIDCSQNCQFQICNQTTGICMNKGCQQIQTCNAGFFWNNATCSCQECIAPCGECVSPSQFQICSSCADNAFTPPLCKSSCQTGKIYIDATLCIEKCPTGQYFDKLFGTCMSCDFGCLECTDFFTCSNGENPTDPDPEDPSPCQSYKYKDSNGVCQACLTECATCNAADKCQSCKGVLGQQFSRQIPLCQCPEGTIIDSVNLNACCPKNCSSCNEQGCFTCKGDSNQDHSRLAQKNCICPDGYYDQNSTIDYNCLACHATCKTCINGNSCLTCKGTLNQLNSRILTSNCSCPQGYYDDGSDDCQVCVSSCQTCSDGSSCQTCKGSLNKVYSRILLSSCQCPDGYYDNGSDADCIKCLSSCKTCQNINSCQTCRGTLNQIFSRVLSSNCSCPVGFYDNESDDCQACSSKCNSCSDGSSCLTCKGTPNQVFSRVLEDVCSCPAGYYENGSDDCQICNDKCSTCNKLNGNCQTCKGIQTGLEKRVVENQCKCPEGFYDNGSDNCVQCAANCQKCSDLTGSCTQCKGTLSQVYSRDLNNNCACPSSFYDSGLDDCQQCSSNCKTCNGALQSDCQNCQGTQGVAYSRQINNQCKCPQGYYDSGAADCVKCIDKCSICSEPSGSCQICLGDQGQAHSRDLSQQCKCPQNYFEQENNDNCAICNQKCSECNSTSGECSKCIGVENLPKSRVAANNCQCPSGFYEVAGQDDCVQCSNLCGTCKNTDGTCLTCIGGTGQANSRDVTKGCTCPSNYYDDGSANCLLCSNPNCDTCESNGNCLTCIGVSGRVQSRKVVDQCACPSGYFESETGECQQCSVQFCDKCSSDGSECTKCQGTQTVGLARDFANGCSCPTKTYDNLIDVNCVQCQELCQTCDASKCLTCVGNNRDPAKNCVCKEGYYLDQNNQCVACSIQGCSQCDSSSCSKCFGNTTLRLPSNSCECQSGYVSGEDYQCISCGISKCSTCTLSVDSITCTQCKGDQGKSYSRITSSNCQCPQGHFDNGEDNCKPCIDGCKNCSGQNSCQICWDDNQVLANSCQCKAGYYSDAAKKSCKTCLKQCTTCADDTSCLTCKGAQNKVYSRIGNICECPVGYFDDLVQDNCQVCSNQCKTCKNKSSCEECVGVLNQTNSRIKSDNCRCPDGFFSILPSFPDCIQCSYKCSKCSDSLACLTCSDSLREISNGCNCPKGYYEILNFKSCGQCQANCLECNSSSSCNICKGDQGKSYSRLKNKNCECPVGFYDDGVSNNCKQCNPNCISCQNSANNCLSCIGTSGSIFSRIKESGCECPTGYISKLEVSEDCQKPPQCLSSCKDCQNSLSCTSCIDTNGLRLINNQCKCPDGYFDALEQGQKNCQTCNYQCITCLNQNVCTACIGSLNKPESRVQPDCSCPLGYFENSQTKECQKCDSKCKTCSNSASSCIICSENIRDPNTCECPQGYYDNNGVCQQCVSSLCKNCDQTLQCTQCLQDQNGIQRTTPGCDCPSGYYANYSQNQNCIQIILCDNPFCSCTTPSDCQSCVGSNRNFANQCKCKDGYFDKNPAIPDCQICDSKCQTCQYQEQNCLACKKQNRVAPSCECLEGYSDNGDYQIDCVKNVCTNQACGLCDSNDQCLLCKNQENSLPSCQCPNGQFLTNTFTCEACSIVCGSCIESQSCTTCKDENKQFNDGNCDICKEGFYLGRQGLCERISCFEECSLCLNESDCLECSNKDRLLPNCSCPQGTKDDLPNSDQCLNCNINCSVCIEDQDNCVSCKGLNREMPSCQCLEGYAPNLDENDENNCILIEPIIFPDVDQGEDGEQNGVPYAAQITIGVATVYATTFSLIPASKATSSAVSTIANFFKPNGLPGGGANPVNVVQPQQLNLRMQAPRNLAPLQNPPGGGIGNAANPSSNIFNNIPRRINRI